MVDQQAQKFSPTKIYVVLVYIYLQYWCIAAHVQQSRYFHDNYSEWISSAATLALARQILTDTGFPCVIVHVWEDSTEYLFIVHRFSHF